MRMRPNHYGVTNLNENLLSDVIPTQTFGGGTVANPEQTLFLWRSQSHSETTAGSDR
jgi:hypothetical protein